MKIRLATWLPPRIPGPIRRAILNRILRRNGLKRRTIRTILPAVDAIVGSRVIMGALYSAIRRARRRR